MTERQLSELISVPVNTLQNWRVSGIGLPFIKMGPGRNAPVRYHIKDVEQFIQEHRRFPSVVGEPTSETAMHPKRPR